MRTAATIASIFLICTLCACAAGPGDTAARQRDLPIEDGPHHPPPVFFADLSYGRTTVRVVMEFPHPGWQYILDDERTTDTAHELFFTIYRPDPRSAYPMVTKTDSATFDLYGAPMATVYARTIDHDLRNIDKPYRFAAEAH